MTHPPHDTRSGHAPSSHGASDAGEVPAHPQHGSPPAEAVSQSPAGAIEGARGGSVTALADDGQAPPATFGKVVVTRPRRVWTGLHVMLWLGLVAMGAEAYLYRFLQDRTHLVRAVEAWRAEQPSSRPTMWVFGTCHSAGLNASRIEDATGGTVHVVNVSAPASTPVDWWVALRAMIAETQAKGQPLPTAIVLAPAGADLMLNPSPWSAQTMELAGWDELFPIVSATCTDLSCVAELSLRHASRLYRTRGYVGQIIWDAIGVPSPAPPVPESDTDGTDAFSPNRFRGSWLPRPMGAVRPSDEAAKPRNRLDAARWEVPSSVPGLHPTVDPYHWTRQLVAEAEAHGIETLIYMIPPQPGGRRVREMEHQRSETASLARQIGATFLDRPAPSTLTSTDYFDDQHMLEGAQRIIAADIGAALLRE